MGYRLGIDLGTTYSAAAVSRDGGAVEVCTLGTTSQSIPTVVVLREDGEVLTGEAAERRAPNEPTRTAREFKRRLGDPVPLIVGSTPYGAEALMALVLRAIVAQVSEREGAAPDAIVLTHPANYSDFKRGLLEEAARLAGLDLSRVQLVTEPQAAAVAYATQQRVEPGEVVAVYDFGGGTFDAAVVRKDEGSGFSLLGSPEGMERLGGIDIDQAVLAHVDLALDGMLTSAGSADPATRSSLVRLREEVRRGKEALSTDTDCTIAVSLPQLQTEVRLTREELEGMIRPRVAETVEALRRAVASTGMAMEDVSRVLLVGGSSRIPLVGLLVRELTGRPVAVDAHPKLAIATGAALLGAAPAAEPEAVAAALPEAPVVAGKGRAGKGALAAAAGTGFAATAAGAAVVGAGGSAVAAAATTPLAGAAAGPAGVAMTSGPVGASLAAGPAGTSVAAGPAGIATSPPAAVVRTAAKVARPRAMLAVAATVGVVAAVGTVALVSSQGDKKPAAAVLPGAQSSATGVASTAPSTPGSAAPGAGARGITGSTALIAGIPGDNSGDGAPGVATAISLGAPSFVAVGADGATYVVDSAANRVLRIAEQKATVAYTGTGTIGGMASSPTGKLVLLTTDGLVDITTGTAVRVAALAELGEGVAPGRQTPLAFDGAGNLYIGHSAGYQVLRRAADGTMTRVAGNGEWAGTSGPKGDGGAATAAPLVAITALVVDSKGNLLFGQPDGALRKVATDGTLSTIAGAGTTRLVLDNAFTFVPDGKAATSLDFRQVDGLAFDPKGRLYVTDGLSGAVVRILGDGTVDFVAGDQSGTAEPTVTGRPANQTRFNAASGMAFEKDGALVLLDRELLLRVNGVATS
ncbi:MAG: Hsp70 family protein [Frankiaceae bacterium]|nr:Hsp70 family protein [Frankiaceae bacterium]